MKIRAFQPHDAAFCFRTRSNAFIQQFYGELTPEEVAAAVNAYLPDDFMQMALTHPFFIVEENSRPVGFFNLKRRDSYTAEIPQIYFDLARRGRGLGSACIGYIENWLVKNWPDVGVLFVDTVIPNYNRVFYEKVGFEASDSTYCEFLGRKLKALRLTKKLLG